MIYSSSIGLYAQFVNYGDAGEQAANLFIASP